MHDAPTSRTAGRNQRRRQLVVGTLLLLFAIVALAPGVGFGTRLGLFGAKKADSLATDTALSAASLSSGVVVADVPAEELLPGLYPELPAEAGAAAVAATRQPTAIPDLPAPAPLLERELIETAAGAQEIASIPDAADLEGPMENALLAWTGHPEYVAAGRGRNWRGVTAGIGSTGGSSGLPSGSTGITPGTDVLTNVTGAGTGLSAPGAKNQDGNESSEGPGNGPSLPEQVPEFVPDLTGGAGQPGDQPTGETEKGGSNLPTTLLPEQGSTLPGDLVGTPDVIQVPEPGTLTLFALGLLGCFTARARQRRT